MMKTIFALAGVLCFGAFAVEPHDHDHAAHDHDHAGHDHAAHDHDHAGHGPAAKGVKAVAVAEAVQKAMGLKTVRPEKRRLASTVAFTGRYELSPDARRTVATPVAGRLALLVKPLARVKAGDALFGVTSPDLAARARELAVLERRMDVYRKLGTKNAPLASELAVKKAEREALVGDAEETNGVITVRAASDGLVEAFPSEAGAWVETGASVVRLVAPEDLRLRALVAASDAARLADGLAATVEGAPGEVRLGVGDANGLVPVYVVFPKGGAKGRAGDGDVRAGRARNACDGRSLSVSRADRPAADRLRAGRTRRGPLPCGGRGAGTFRRRLDGRDGPPVRRRPRCRRRGSLRTEARPALRGREARRPLPRRRNLPRGRRLREQPARCKLKANNDTKGEQA